MMDLCSVLRAFAADSRGVTAVEYGLIAVLIAATIAGTVAVLGTSLVGPLVSLSNSL